MAAKPQLDLPVLDEVVDPAGDRARLLSALDELGRLIDKVPGGGASLDQIRLAELQDELTQRLTEMADELAERLKQQIPSLVEQTLREHLDKKNAR